jgi:hypothetical protein
MGRRGGVSDVKQCISRFGRLANSLLDQWRFSMGSRGGYEAPLFPSIRETSCREKAGCLAQRGRLELQNEPMQTLAAQPTALMNISGSAPSPLQFKNEQAN